MQVQPYFEEELKNTINAINEKKEEGDLLFSLVADSHLSDNTRHTIQNIYAVDKAVNFSFLAHLGDLLCGNIPEKVSRRLLKEELANYQFAIKSKKIYVAQGNHDGYRDETYKGQTVPDMAIDEKWYEDLEFFHMGENIHTQKNKPYFYVDIPKHQLRLIFLCTTGYNIDTEKKEFEKLYGISSEQIEWLASTALDCPSGYSVMVFSHIHPFGLKDKNENGDFCISPRKEENYETAVNLLKAYNSSSSCTINGKIYDYTDKDGTFVCWFFGHDHCDAVVTIEGFNYIGVASQTAYIPQLWEAIGYFPSPRELDTVSEDAWDSVLWKKNERKLYMFRFGAGDDRVISY